LTVTSQPADAALRPKKPDLSYRELRKRDNPAIAERGLAIIARFDDGQFPDELAIALGKGGYAKITHLLVITHYDRVLANAMRCCSSI
jgi:hypothetical protein